MNLERFTTLIEAYGSDPRRWPDAERQAAQSLLAASAEAQQLMRQAASFDALLSVPPVEIEPGAALKARVLAQVAPRPVLTTTWRSQIAEALALLFPRGGAMPQFAALGLALAIGVGAGLANIGPEMQDEDLIVLQLAAANPIHLEE